MPDSDETKAAKKEECMAIVDYLYDWAAQQRFAIGTAAVELAALDVMKRHLTDDEAMKRHVAEIRKRASK